MSVYHHFRTREDLLTAAVEPITRRLREVVEAAERQRDEFCAAAPGVYGAGDVARWHNPLFGAEMRIEHRTNAAEQGMAAARNLLRPDARKPFAPVPYLWSDQYDLRIQAYGYLRGHDAVAVVEGDLAERRFVAVYRGRGRVVGAVAAGMSPKALRPWRQAIAAGEPWPVDQKESIHRA